MPGRSKDSTNKKSSRLQLEKLYKKCRYCNANRPTNRFDKHQKACKTKSEILQQRRRIQATQPDSELLIELEAERSNSGHHIESEFVQGSSTMLVDMVNDLPISSPSIPEQTGAFQYVLQGSN
jgi:hypothetical protein